MLRGQANHQYLSNLSSSLSKDTTALLGEARIAIEAVQREVAVQSATANKLNALESKLSVLEGAVLGAAKGSHEAAVAVNHLQQRLSVDTRASQEAVAAAVRQEVRRAAQTWVSEETAALARLDTRLAAVEGSISGLEVAQSEGLRRLGMSLSSLLVDAEATLQVGGGSSLDLVHGCEFQRCLSMEFEVSGLKAASICMLQHLQFDEQAIR